MPATTPDLRPGRLSPEDYQRNFADAAPRMSPSEALLEAERCLYCYHAPCMQACPTEIDIPSFIRRIADGNLRGSARTILDSNPIGGMCARVCPTEELCEQACVRTAQEGKPVAIGRLQRYAVDALFESERPQVFSRAASTGKTVAVVGAGPAGLSCAHKLARAGHDVVIYESRGKAGGLNEFGIAAYKTADGFAQREIHWLLGLGGIRIEFGAAIDSAAALQRLRDQHDAVFLSVGLSDTHQLGVNGEDLHGVQDAVRFIEQLRQASDLASLPVGRRVLVIGGGMTAIDAATQSKLLGAEIVDLVYRRGPTSMPASKDEQQWAQTHGVTLHHWLAPSEILGENGHVCAVRFERQAMVAGKLQGTGEFVEFAADMVLKAIGQKLGNTWLTEAGFEMTQGKLKTDPEGQTSLQGVWAGGDCRAGGLDLTVEAAQHGKLAAAAIDQFLKA